MRGMNMPLRYLSVCSGIEAASVAWEPLGWRPVAFSEIDAFPSAVLAHHYPSVPNWGDMTCFKEWPDAAVDLLAGGTPCQSFSVAGLRKGLDDPRGNLALVYLGLVDRYRPKWVVWENVPGVLSSSKGRDFGAFLGGLSELGYGWAYRVLDAQYIRTRRFSGAVPQRRRRVFVVGYLGDWRPPAAVLFEPESLRGNPPPRREPGQGLTHDVAWSLVSSGRGVERCGETRGQDPVVGLIRQGFGGGNTSGPIDVAACLTAKGQRIDFEVETFVAHSLRGEGFDAQAGGNTWLAIGEEVAGTPHGGGSHGGRAAVATRWAVRRLTPLECERLQGFPDGYTDVPYRKRNWTPDGPRYKALGNSMAVNAMEWLGQRIEYVRGILAEQERKS